MSEQPTGQNVNPTQIISNLQQSLEISRRKQQAMNEMLAKANDGMAEASALNSLLGEVLQQRDQTIAENDAKIAALNAALKEEKDRTKKLENSIAEIMEEQAVRVPTVPTLVVPETPTVIPIGTEERFDD